MIKYFFLVSLFIFLGGATTFSQDKAELERQKKETIKELEQVSKQLSGIQKNKKESLGELALVQKKIRLRNNVISNINHTINIINNDIYTSRREINRLKSDLDTLKAAYAKNVVYSYKNRSNYDFLNFLFSATSFNDAFRRLAYMKSYRAYREKQAENILKTQQLLEGKITQLNDTRKERSEVLGEQSKEMQKLKGERKEHDDVVKGLKSREKELSGVVAAKKKQLNKLSSAIDAIVRREIEAAKKEAARLAAEKKKNEEANKTTTSVANTETKTEAPAKKETTSLLLLNDADIRLNADFEKNRGNLPWPVDQGYVFTPWGPNKIPETSITWNNPAVTIGTKTGTVVKAVFTGEVTAIFELSGNFGVTIQHGKYFTTYSNLSGVSVTKGQKVTTGQAIGRAAAGEEGEGQVDFVLMNERKNINPQDWLKRF